MHKIFFYNKFIIRLYMFRALCVHHQAVKIVLNSIWYHHTCRWPSCAQAESGLSPLSTKTRFCSLSWLIAKIMLRFLLSITIFLIVHIHSRNIKWVNNQSIRGCRSTTDLCHHYNKHRYKHSATCLALLIPSLIQVVKKN